VGVGGDEVSGGGGNVRVEEKEVGVGLEEDENCKG